jgi:IMP and pyridine-specific 5'-nucleotidase
MITVSPPKSSNPRFPSSPIICVQYPADRPPVAHQKVGLGGQSKLKLLVPSIGTFFTRLPLADAFRYQDKKRFISSRRFVPPSFNDIRLILNTAQLMGVTAAGPVDLATFDGDVTL